MFCMECNSLNNFERVPKYLRNIPVIFLDFIHWLGEVVCRTMWTDDNSDDDSDKSSPCTSCSGELKIEKSQKWELNYQKELKTLLQKEKLLIMSKFLVCHNVFKSSADKKEAKFLQPLKSFKSHLLQTFLILSYIQQICSRRLWKNCSKTYWNKRPKRASIAPRP